MMTTVDFKVPERLAPFTDSPEPKCTECHDLGVLIGPAGETRACGCGLWKRRNVARWAAKSQIPEHVREGFATWNDGGVALLANVRRQMEQWAERFEPRSGEGMLLSGNPGAGKSHLCGAAAWRVLQRGHSALFWNVCEMMARIRFTIGNDGADETEADILEAAQRADLLVLDDVGAEKPSAFTLDRLFVIVNARLNAKRPMLVTTNLGPEAMAGRIGHRLASRLYEAAPGGNRILMSGLPDFRRSRKRGRTREGGNA